MSGEEQRDPMIIQDRDDARGEHALAIRCCLLLTASLVWLIKGCQTENLHARIIVVEDLARSGGPNQGVMNRNKDLQAIGQDIPLGRSWQGNAPLICSGLWPRTMLWEQWAAELEALIAGGE